jgi:hypothetical protein
MSVFEFVVRFEVPEEQEAALRSNVPSATSLADAARAHLGDWLMDGEHNLREDPGIDVTVRVTGGFVLP